MIKTRALERVYFRTTNVVLKQPILFLAAFVITLSAFTNVAAQAGDHMLYGDLNVDESKVTGLKPLTFDVILYTEGGVLVSRQPVSNNGRFRFNNLPVGAYQLVIEVEAKEVARVNVDLRSPLLRDVRRDVALEWKSTDIPATAGVISAGDEYVRNSANQKIFKLARAFAAHQQHLKAIQLLQQLVVSDPKDFQAWAELANIHFRQRTFNEAEIEYLHAIDARPRYFQALFNLGRLEITLKKYDVAAEVLAKAVKLQPQSPDANYFLGDSYLQMKKGSVAVTYLNEALRLDPDGMAEIHLRLATLYHLAGLRDKAANEYESFLRKRPGYRDRKKLEKYIAENKKTAGTD